MVCVPSVRFAHLVRIVYTWCVMCVLGVRYAHLVCGVYGRYGERDIVYVHTVYGVCCVC